MTDDESLPSRMARLTPEQRAKMRTELCQAYQEKYPQASDAVVDSLVSGVMNAVTEGQSVEEWTQSARVMFEAELMIGDPVAAETASHMMFVLVTELKPVYVTALATGKDPVDALVAHSGIPREQVESMIPHLQGLVDRGIS